MSGRYGGGMGLSQGFIQGFQVMDNYQRGQRQLGLAEQASARADERHQWAQDDRDRLDDQRLVQAMNQGVQTGQIDPKIAMQFGERFDVDWSNYVDPEFGSALGVLESTVQGQTSMKSPEFNRAFERVFRTEINKGTGEEYEGADGAHRIEQKRLAGVYPGPDGKTLLVDLEVLDRGPAGEQWRKAPVTQNRSAKDDEVRAIPLAAALDKLKGHQLMFQSVQASPELQAVIQQYAARTGAELPKPQTSDAWRKTQELQQLGLDPDAARNNAYGIKPPQNTRYGQPFQHPQLGWVQPGPDGQLQQLDTTNQDRYGDAFEHPQLGWVQPGPDGRLTQLKAADEGGDPEWVRLNDGALFNKRTGETRRAGVEPPNDGTGGLDSSVMSQIQQTARNFHGSFNPDGSFMGIPEGAREKYALAMERAQALVAKGGMSVFEATNLANLSVGKQLTSAEAERLAEQEAEQEVQGWFRGRERDEFVKRRAQELVAESRQAEQRYNRIMGNDQQAAETSPRGLEMAGSAVPQADGSYSGRVIRGAGPGLQSSPTAPPAAQAPATAQQPAPPKPGTVISGYEFLGGNPADKKNWKKVTQ